MRTIGIVCACDTELEPFLPHLEGMRISENAMYRFYSGFLAGQPAVCVRCGVCKVNAALATQLLIDCYHADMIINCGTAGGMDPQVHIFDTVISERVAHHDVEAGILTEQFPYMETEFFPAGGELLKAAEKAVRRGITADCGAASCADCGAASGADCGSDSTDSPEASDLAKLHRGKIHFGTMVSGEAFIDCEGRAEINRRFAPLTVDMETAGIAHACYLNGVPFLSVRTVTDTEEERGISVYSDNSAQAEKTAAQITLAVVKELSREKNG